MFFISRLSQCQHFGGGEKILFPTDKRKPLSIYYEIINPQKHNEPHKYFFKIRRMVLVISNRH